MTDPESLALARTLAGAVLSDPASGPRLRAMAASVLGDGSGRGSNVQMIAGRIKPADMPVFVLFASDLAAPDAIASWVETARVFGAKPDILASAMAVRHAMQMWQGEKHVPDLPAPNAPQIVADATAATPAIVAGPANAQRVLCVRIPLVEEPDQECGAAEVLCRIGVAIARAGLFAGAIEDEDGAMLARFWIADGGRNG